ncbi:hypothetical protein, partial [Fulvivirga kasyanovii]|uniref:hypothetical protein n=1 Tax=Fulvivirga kasyanovii TaxID=396812 RepID=UPI00162414C9
VVTEADNGHLNGNGINTNGYNQSLLGYPATACSDSYYAWGAGGTYKLTGLESVKQYSVKIFGSRIHESGGGREGSYTINGVTQTLDGANNTSEYIVFENLTADANGEILLDFGVASGATFGYINVLELI